MKKITLKKLWNKSTLRRLSIIALVFGGILVGTPYAFQYAISQGINSLEGQQVRLNDVDFNPFTGVLIIKGLQSSNAKASKLNIPLLSIQLDWLPLFNKQILVKSFVLQNARISVDKNQDNQPFIAGLKLPPLASAADNSDNKASPWGFGVEKITLLNNQINVSTPAFATNISIDDLKLNSLFSWQPTQQANFSFAMHIDDAAVSAELELLAFADRPHIKGRLNVEQLSLSHLQPHTDNKLTQLKGRLSTALTFELSLDDNQLHYRQQGSITLDDLLLATDAIQLAQKQLAWNGEVDFSTTQQLNTLTFKGRLALDEHQNTLASPELKTGIKTVSWDGLFSLRQHADKSNLSINGELSAQAINTQSLSSKQTLLQLNTLTLKALSIQQLDNIQLANMTLEGLTLAKAATKKPLMQAKNVSFNTLKLSKLSDIELEKLTINGITGNVHINQQGTVSALDEFIGSLTAHTAENHIAKPAAIAEKEQKPFIRVGQIMVTGDNQIQLSSATISHSINKSIQLKSLTMGEINNRRTTIATPFKLHATINQHSKLELSGDITPFSQQTNAQLNAKLTAFELPEFSPIIRQELGYEIESGQLNAEINGVVNEDVLNGKVNIAIHKLLMQAADQNKAAKVTQQLTMPLDSALSLLRDENDDIELEIPIKGDIAQPDFEIGSVINTAIGNALQGTVTSYLKYALQPYGLIYMAAESAYGAATKLSLQPIKFQAGELQRPESANQYLHSIGQLLQKRPQLTLRLCGFATGRDRLKLLEMDKKNQPASSEPAELAALLDEQLLLLAGNRQQWLKSYFISSYQINENRLFTCLPKVSAGKNQLPRVELLI